MYSLLYVASIFLAAFVIFETVWLTYCGLRTKVLAKRTKLYSREEHEIDSKVLIVGDSFILGIGASDPGTSLAGRIGNFYQNASITVRAVSGVKLKQAVELVTLHHSSKRWGTVVLFCGGMNIVHFASRKKIEEELRKLLRHVKSCAENVIYISPGNTGLVPAFHFPLSSIYAYRARKFHAIAKVVSEEEGVTFIDIFYEEESNPLRGKGKSLYVSDFSHLNDEGYGILFEQIRSRL